MNKNLLQLFSIAQKTQRNIIGLMSGTSMDGLDVALCRFEGSGSDTKITLTHFETVPYTDDIKSKIQAVFAKETIDLWYQRAKMTIGNRYSRKLQLSDIFH